MGDKKLNGSAGLLADAMKKVFAECMETAHETIASDMSEMETRPSDKIAATNKSMQSQFAEQEKKIGKLLRHAC